ncbi:MAG: hypothetical protein DWB43_13405 [Lautropia sp.]|nr:MAG: hypothetical protein EDM78_05895 [Pseudomonadota bacterium]MBC6960511.1 hypothetical protein [Lautropia sp.]MCL4701125.1 hypothetical protein [Burkholderiaceae bacterium]MCZ2412654.1 hypothetical protein [Burkholderiales bacterium]MDL1908841.1 hypothetical protein [Betaproteobacteria bacterium PRO1]
MKRAGLRRERSTPRAAAWMLAVPLAAAGAAALASGAHDAATDADDALPGLDARRVVVPAGELAGHAVQVSEVASRLDPVEALARVERRWRSRDGAVVLRADSGAWRVLSRRTERGYETLQLRASLRGGAEGLLTRWRERDRRAVDAVGSARLLPADAKVVRQLGSHDAAAGGARTTDTLIGSLPHSIDEAERRIELHLRRSGFVPMRAPGAARELGSRNDRARFFRAPGAELLVTLHAQAQGTGVVLYHVRAAQ